MKLEYEKELKELYKYSDIDLLRYFKTNPSSLAFFPLSKRLFQKSKFIEVVQILLMGTKHYPDLNEASILLAKAYSKLDLDIDAVNTLNEIINRSPKYALGYYYLSTILYKQELDDKAEILLIKAYELDPKDPDIKNSFQIHFSSSYNATMEIQNISEIVQHTVAESYEDVKRRSEKLLDIKKIEEVQNNKLDFFENLEKEFINSKKWRYSAIIFFMTLFIGGIIFLTIHMTEKDKVKNYKKDMITLLNNNLDMKTINQTVSDKVFFKLKDITEFYQILYHYQKDYTKFLNIVEDVKKRDKFKTEWEYLSRMTYLLYEGEYEKFDTLYSKMVSKNKEFSKNPNISILRAHKLIRNKDMLNATSYLKNAYKKSNKGERFKVELSLIYLYQRNFTSIKKLFENTIPISDEGDLFLELSRVETDKLRIEILKKYIKKIPQRLTKRRLTFLLAKIYLDNNEINNFRSTIDSLSDIKIPYYCELKQLFSHLK